MEFTYLLVAFLALLIGFVASLVFVFLQGRSIPRLIGLATLVTTLFSAAVFINWTAVGDAPGAVLLLDAVIFPLYSLVGCTIGAAPAITLRWLARAWTRDRNRIANSSSGTTIT